MPYNNSTLRFEFDFDSMSFPITLSDNVLEYFFFFYLKWDTRPEKIAEVKSLLRGEDRSPKAVEFFCRWVEGKEIPPQDFDILIDETFQVEKPRYPMRSTSIHKGVCVLGEKKFNFEYETSFDIYSKPYRHLKKIVLEGDDFYGRIEEDIDLIDACKSYFELKKRTIDTDNRRKSFLILSDQISDTTRIKPGAVWYTIEHHTGVCTIGDLTFKFEYQSDNAPLFAGFNRDKKKRVVLEGDDFVAVSEESICDACMSYFEQKQIALEKQRLKEATENEEKIWVEFRRKHKQELIDWLSPSLETCSGPVCSRKRRAITSGVLRYSAVVKLERGICSDCTAPCRFPILVPEGQDHSDKWYEIGLDELHFEYL